LCRCEARTLCVEPAAYLLCTALRRRVET
jgi:hypothetical protein